MRMKQNNCDLVEWFQLLFSKIKLT